MKSAPAPRHSLARRARAAALVVLVAGATALASVFLVREFVVLTAADRYVQDYEIATQSRAQPSDGRIVVVAVDEATLQRFAYRSPLDRGFLAKLVARIDAARPRAIGIDILFDQPTEAAKDAALARTLHSAKSPLVIAYTEEPENVTPRQLSYERGFVPAAMRATPDLPRDEYGTVRTVHPGMRMADGRYVFSFERALAARFGVPTPREAVPIVWKVPAAQDASNYYEIAAQKIADFPDAVMPLLAPALFRDKIVLIGSDLSLVDRHRTPLAVLSDRGNMPGVLIHAYGLSTLLDGAHSPDAGWQANLAAALILALGGALLGALNIALVPRLAVLVLALGAFFAACVYLYHFADILLGLVAPALAMVGSFSAMDSLSGREARRQRQFIQGAFSRYVSPKVVEALVADPSRMSLDGERREMTYLFTDVANFTTMSEKIDSKDLAHLLNAYFEGVTEIVLRHDGMVDKFIGDAVFAIFNAPVDVERHQQRAVRCALEIDRFCENFRKQQNAAGIEFGVTRIGVHTGAAVVGNFGSRSRFNYTAQGDAVNTAARLEGFNKYIGTHACVSGATAAACPDMLFRPLGAVVLKGKDAAIDVLEPLWPGELRGDYLDRYNAAYAALDRPGEALAMFESLAAQWPGDPCVRFHAARLREGEHGARLTMMEK